MIVKGRTMNFEALRNMLLVAVLSSLAVLHSLAASAANLTPSDAAKQLFPDYEWQTPALTGDFRCDGKFGYALLGLTKTEALVIVFLEGLDHAPEKIAVTRDPLSDDPMTLSDYSLDISDNEFKEMIGAVPEGFRRSKHCKGLSLTDGDTDPYNFYWNKKIKSFSMWRL
jgi:hypothetical protein